MKLINYCFSLGNNQLETFSGYMVNEFNALTVGHKANKILKFQENYNAWIRFEVYNVQSYMPVDHNGVIFRDIPVIDVQVLTANVQKGMPGDIAVLTVSFKMEIELRIINFL